MYCLVISIFKSTSRRPNIVCCLLPLPTSREDGGRVARVPISHCSPVQPAEGGPELLWWALSPVAGQWLRGLRLGQLTRWTPRAVGQPCGNAKFDSPLCSPKAMPLCLMTINHYSLTKLTAANTLFTLSCWVKRGVLTSCWRQSKSRFGGVLYTNNNMVWSA